MNNSQNVISIATLLAPKLDLLSLKIDGNVLHVLEPNIIRLFSQAFRVPYKVFIPSDGGFGVQLPNKSWSGMLGMVEREEVDLAIGTVILNEERIHSFNFSYPYSFTEVAFMTDKLKPVSTSLSLIYPFSLTSWIFLTVCIALVSFLLIIVTKKKQIRNDILLWVFGSVLGHAINVNSRDTNLRLLLGSWMIFIFVITNSYRSLLVFFLSFPPLTGIKDIAALTKAAEESLVDCYTYKGTIFSQVFLKSEFYSWKTVGNCLQRNASSLDVRDASETFLKAPPGKAFIGPRMSLEYFKRDYFIAKDSFFKIMYAIPTSRNFCCLKYLNTIIHRLFAAGYFQKLEDDRSLLMELKLGNSDSNEVEIPKPLGLSDIQLALVVLIFGHTLALLCFLIEIVAKCALLDKKCNYKTATKIVKKARKRSLLKLQTV